MILQRPVELGVSDRATKAGEDSSNSNQGPWSVVLAGGDGVRLSPLMERWLGLHRPKQYCVFVGTRSMLQHTLDRVDRISSPERKVTVINCSHKQVALPQFEGRPGNIIIQPANRGTAAGIFLALTYVRRYDPRATVVIHPSDHFVYPEEHLIRELRRVVELIPLLGDRLILVGIVPNQMEMDYGWILPGHSLGWYGEHEFRSVSAFVEKPSPTQARKAADSGGLWNTFLMAATVETLWQLGWRCLPGLMELFEILGEKIGTIGEDQVLQSVYAKMLTHDFSRKVLEQAVDRTVVYRLENILWSDWGREERIIHSLCQVGKRPHFAEKNWLPTNPGVPNGNGSKSKRGDHYENQDQTKYSYHDAIC
jgi:mannose-1-phosphate guanylyltransferase